MLNSVYLIQGRTRESNCEIQIEMKIPFRRDATHVYVASIKDLKGEIEQMMRVKTVAIVN